MNEERELPEAIEGSLKGALGTVEIGKPSSIIK